MLVVEDDPLVLKMLGVALRQHGFGVRLATGGEEAIVLYRQHHRAISIVLLDVRMPGLDGARTLTHLRELDPDVRCCFMSGHAGHYSEDDLSGMGASHVFVKPFTSLLELAQTLWRLAMNPG